MAGTPVARAATARPATTEAFIAVLRDRTSLIFLNICELPSLLSSDFSSAGGTGGDGLWERYRASDLTANCPTNEKFVM
jgi:hypothetical protein